MSPGEFRAGGRAVLRQVRTGAQKLEGKKRGEV